MGARFGFIVSSICAVAFLTMNSAALGWRAGGAFLSGCFIGAAMRSFYLRWKLFGP
jgi:hypothetical protein